MTGLFDPVQLGELAEPMRSRSRSTTSAIRISPCGCATTGPLATANRQTYYGGSDAGYSDYPPYTPS